MTRSPGRGRVSGLRAKFPKAVSKITDDADELLASFAYPDEGSREHVKHLVCCVCCVFRRIMEAWTCPI
jgi:hypothetical protein